MKNIYTLCLIKFISTGVRSFLPRRVYVRAFFLHILTESLGDQIVLTDWKVAEKVYNKDWKHNALVFFSIFFSNFLKFISVWRLDLYTLRGRQYFDALCTNNNKLVNLQFVSPYSSATRTVNCLDIYIFSIFLLELLCDSSSKEAANYFK